MHFVTDSEYFDALLAAAEDGDLQATALLRMLHSWHLAPLEFVLRIKDLATEDWSSTARKSDGRVSTPQSEL